MKKQKLIEVGKNKEEKKNIWMAKENRKRAFHGLKCKEKRAKVMKKLVWKWQKMGEKQTFFS